MESRLKRIALVLNKDLVRCRGILRGILRHARGSPDWILHTVASLSPSRMELLKRWSPDGIIAEVLSDADETALRKFDVPTVSVSQVIDSKVFPRVIPDHASIGEAVGRHLVEGQLRDFGYIGPPGREDARLQRGGFARVIAQSGGRLHESPPMIWGADWSSMDERMGEWLARLPRPFGLMLFDDDWGLWVTQLCRLRQIRIPDEAAVVGVNDDRLNCDLAEPALSSVGIPLEQIGIHAAQVLARMLSGRKASPHTVKVPHLGVTSRPSSDILTIPDPDIVAAVRFVRTHAHTRIGVRDILVAVPVSRRILERKFREHLGCTPLQIIRRTQIEAAQQLLARADSSLKDIAQQIGFDNVYHLCRLFKKLTGQTPMQYRRQFRA